MVGDNVKIKEPNKYAGAIGTIRSLSSSEGAYFSIYINDPKFGTLVTEVFCEDIEPIPLTVETLEKNGLIKGLWNRYSLSPVISFTIEFANDSFYFRTTECRLCKIKSVSHLQHLLRDFGIDKEIVL
jgi:hypothetical protein